MSAPKNSISHEQLESPYIAWSTDISDFGWRGPEVRLQNADPTEAWSRLSEKTTRPLDLISFGITDDTSEDPQPVIPGLYYPGGRFLPTEMIKLINDCEVFVSGTYRPERDPIGYIATLRGALQIAYEGDETLPVDLSILGDSNKVLSLEEIVDFYVNHTTAIGRVKNRLARK